MKHEGPRLEALLRRLSECPEEFLAEPRPEGATDGVVVPAIVYDLLRDLGGGPLTKESLSRFVPSAKLSASERSRFGLILLACWLLHDRWFRERREFATGAHLFLSGGLNELAALATADQCLRDPERREEFVRLCLKGLGLRPAGETPPQAADRLSTLDSVERVKFVKAAREAEKRAAEIRAALEKKRQEEAAAAYGRE